MYLTHYNIMNRFKDITCMEAISDIMFWIKKGIEYLKSNFKHHRICWFWIHLLKTETLIYFNVKNKNIFKL